MSNHPDIPVVCTLCGTRMYAMPSQIGKGLKCPDCFTINVVTEPPPEPKRTAPAEVGPEYRLASEPSEIVDMKCTSCHATIRARAEHAGRKVRCPKCDAANVVPQNRDAVENIDAYQLGAETTASPTKKQVADRIMARAREHVEQKIEEDAAEIPVSPFVSGVFNFPLHGSIIPIWTGMAICIVAMGLLLNQTVDLLSVRSYSMILGVFVGLIFGVVLAFTMMYFPPMMLSITEVTATGRDKIEFSSSDFFDRLHTLFLIFNAIAFGSMPGLLLASGAGVSKWLALCSTVFLFPVCLLSMLETASPWKLYSHRVKRSFSAAPGSWLMFYATTIPMTAGSMLLIGSIFSADQKWIALGAFALLFPIVSVMYFRLLGRLALMIGESEIGRELNGLQPNG